MRASAGTIHSRRTPSRCILMTMAVMNSLNVVTKGSSSSVTALRSMMSW